MAKTGQNAIKYSIITAFSKKGIDAAEKGLKKLRESFKKTTLSNKLTFAAIGAGLAALAAKSLAAAKEQDKLQRKLEFSLKTLGETTAIPSVNRFLDTLERQTGIANDQLTPAFMSLARVTSEITDAYDALNLALDIAAITGDDVATIADAMAKGFAGNATSLSKLIPGLDKAAIKAADMQAIMKRLNAEFGGAAQGTMESYAQKFAKLRISINKSFEIIGQGLIDLLQGLTKTTSIEDLGKALEKFAAKVANILRGLPTFFRIFFAEMKKQFEQNIFGRILLKYLEAWANGLEKAADAAAKYGYYANERKMGGFGPRLWEIKNTEKWSKTITATIGTIKKVNFKSKLSDMFDLNKIALAAAKRNGILDKEQQTRIEALQALNTDQLSDDEEYFKKLLGLSMSATNQLIADQNKVADNLKTSLAAQLKDFQDTYDAMAMKYTTANIGGKMVTAPKDFGLPITSQPNLSNVSGGFYAPTTAIDAYMPNTGNASGSGTTTNWQAPINVTVNAAAIGSEEYLVGIVGDALTKYTRLGNVTAPAGFF